MTLHKQKLLNDFSYLNLPTEITDKIKDKNVNVYEAYILIIDYINNTIKNNKSI